MTEARLVTRRWRYAYAAGIEGLPWDVYSDGPNGWVDGWLVASVKEESDAAHIVEAHNALPAAALCGYPGCDKPASDPIHPPKATTTKRSGQHWFEGYLPAAAPAEGCDVIVNSGMGEPTECGRTLPCEYHSAAAPAEGPPHRDTRVPPDLSEDRDGEHCYDCGKAVGLVWTAPDAMWAKVTDRADGGGLLCVLCFDRRAEQRGRPLRWVPQPLAAPAEGLREALAALVEATTHLGQYREVGQLDFCESSPHEGYCGAAMHALGRARAALARHESGSE